VNSICRVGPSVKKALQRHFSPPTSLLHYLSLTIAPTRYGLSLESAIMISDNLQFYFKTKIVKSTEMDFSAADYFDEEDRLNAMIPQEQKQAAKTGTTAWIKRVRYVVFG
jgi:hypothetical protein